MKKLAGKKGFTLVELLVVMAIISILATVILSGFRASQRRSRDAVRKSDLRQIGQALELFNSDHNQYPVGNSGRIAACPFNTAGPETDCQFGTGEMEDNEGHLYFRQLPNDPVNDGAGTPTYYYRSLTGQRAFQIYAHLENPEDQNCINSDCSDTGLPLGVDCGGVDCNFAITSTNVTAKDN